MRMPLKNYIRGFTDANANIARRAIPCRMRKQRAIDNANAIRGYDVEAVPVSGSGKGQ